MNTSHATTDTPANGCPAIRLAGGGTYMDRQQRHRAELIAKVAALHEAGDTRRRERDATDPGNPWVRIQLGAGPGPPHNGCGEAR